MCYHICPAAAVRLSAVFLSLSPAAGTAFAHRVSVQTEGTEGGPQHCLQTGHVPGAFGVPAAEDETAKPKSAQSRGPGSSRPSAPCAEGRGHGAAAGRGSCCAQLGHGDAAGSAMGTLQQAPKPASSACNWAVGTKQRILGQQADKMKSTKGSPEPSGT